MKQDLHQRRQDDGIQKFHDYIAIFGRFLPFHYYNDLEKAVTTFVKIKHLSKSPLLTHFILLFSFHTRIGDSRRKEAEHLLSISVVGVEK